MDNLEQCADISEMIFLASQEPTEEVSKKPKRKGGNKMYAEGTWVKIVGDNYDGYVGYILEVFHAIREYKIQLIKNKYDLRHDTEIILHDSYCYRADIEGGYDLSFMDEHAINWCLDNGYKELFHQILNEKGGNKDVEI